ncbi:MAG TPA: DMT family transporter [Symbiobacteriaceae bacterium]
MASWLTWLLVILGGIAAALQAPVNATLAAHIRPIPAALISFLGGCMTLLVLTLVSMRGQGITALVSGLAAAPRWSYLGGLAGALVVTAVIVGTAKLGVNATLSLLVAVQLIVALLIDTFGFGITRPLPVHWPQVVGLLLIIGGVRLVLWR